MTDTKNRLMTAALTAVCEVGIAGVSARTIAANAEVNQALIFYHFGTVDELIEQATQRSVDERVADYRAAFSSVRTLPELLSLGRELQQRERGLGNVALMAQLMAGAQRNETLARACRYAMSAWNAEIEDVVARTLAASPLSEIADIPGVARVISAAFIGLELYDGVDPAGAAAALDALERVSVLIDVVDDLGAVARRSLRAKVRKRGAKRGQTPPG